jgi:hypothetical protein
MELTEQQTHFKNLLEQRNQLVEELNSLSTQSNSKREMLLKVTGALEYLNTIGVTLEQVDTQSEESASAESEELKE